MGQGTLTIYSSSAGSGKTFQLTGIYLARLFRSAHSYRRMLAVTFTNKATAEMKNRILGQLDNLANGRSSDYLDDLIAGTGKPEEKIRREARTILGSILNDYSRFSVSTIDSFFQKILRAFARETGLHSGFNVETDYKAVLSQAVDETIASASEDETLKKWLISFVKSNLGEERSWNLKNEIALLSEELFREKYKTLTDEEKSRIDDKSFLTGYMDEMRSITSEFESTLREYGEKSAQIYSGFELSDDMFYQKGKGVPSLIRSLASGEIKEPGSYPREIMKDPPRWCTGTIPPKLLAAMEEGLEELLIAAIEYYDGNIIFYKSAKAVLANIFSLGILSDVLKNVRRINADENNFLLADTGEFIYRIIENDQTPFIYEKTGIRFENFMIDEFQDTSVIQWENFRPLIDNSMSEGNDNLVVGDVKQSIYRWRNSNWRILGYDLKSRVDNERFLLKQLKTNWRSLSNIIAFNNSLFTIIPSLMDKEFEGENVPASFSELYSEAVQDDPREKSGGYVRLEFVEENEMKWQESVLEKLPSVIEALQDKGYRASDFGIIVRDNREGANVIRRMIDYSSSMEPGGKPGYNYSIISNDSLLLDRSFAVTFILSVMAVLDNPEDMISKALMLRYYLLASGWEDAEEVPLQGDRLDELSRINYPEGYDDFMNEVKQYPLFEMTERISGFFGLGNYPAHTAYLNAFQDITLTYTGNRSSGIRSFLDWWETAGSGKSVVLPEYQDAIRVLTIHKAKGLEFKVVILPFISWNLDHKTNRQPVLWVRPDRLPFNKPGIVPVKYRKELAKTIFADDYTDERYSAYIDNINLLYVALTRARNVIYGFIPAKPKATNGIAAVVKKALLSDPDLSGHYNPDTGLFESGEIPPETSGYTPQRSIDPGGYFVSFDMGSLKLRLHGENYLSQAGEAVRERINYGTLMHEIFERIITASDVAPAVRKLVSEGKISEKEAGHLEERIISLVTSPGSAGWFSPGNRVLTEQSVLLPSGSIRRPDRVIFKNGRIIIVDFKFGEEAPHHRAQVSSYVRLLSEMGYRDIEAFLWYPDTNKITRVN
ncbi:MAG: UvrD-helicase domain-containing protein [Bacteroidales bacterium]